jgi:signal transduction histidine kinase
MIEQKFDFDGIKKCPYSGFQISPSECLYDFLFNKIDFGVQIFDFSTRKTVFSNYYYKQISRGNEKLIMDSLIEKIAGNKALTFMQDIIECSSNYLIIGYSIYELGTDYYVAFLKDISTKEIYLETLKRGQFFTDFSRVVAEIAHEVGNPLSAIDTTLQVVIHNINQWDVDKLSDYLTRTVNEIKRLSDFLQKIKNFALHDHFDIHPINLNQLISKLFNQNELNLKSKNIQFQINVDASLDVLIDKNAFYQILLNLFNNSLEALADTPGGEIRIYVDEVDDYFVKLIFKNNGRPIPEEFLNKIFMPLFSSKDKGRGLGLPISLKLMTEMGGTIQAFNFENDQGVGFVLYIPHRKYHI